MSVTCSISVRHHPRPGGTVNPLSAGLCGSTAGRQFVIAADSDSLVEVPAGPPSATFTPVVPKGGH
jgi:hypothetical protein